MRRRKMPRRRQRNYYSSHRKNILSEQVSNKNKLEPGHIVKFRYTGKDVHEPRPLVLVLNPSWEGKLHGLALHTVSEETLNDLYDIVKESLAAKVAKKLKLKWTPIKSDIRNPEDFYERRLKPFIREHFPKGESPYRTYTLKGVKNVRIIDYRFREKYRPKQ